MKVGDRAETPNGSHHDIIRITEDSGIQLSDCYFYCRSELKLVDNKPTKTKLIDKAIDDLGGDISKANYHGRGYNNLWRNGANYWLAADDSIAHIKGDTFCTIEEFEQRKKEREMENINWYDYKNQRITGKPPIGCKVLYDDYKEGLIEVIILGYHPSPDNDAVWSQAIGSFGDDTNYSTDSLCNFRPLDWDKLSKRKQAINYAMELSPDWAKLEDIFGSLYDAGVLKLPDGSKAVESK